MSYHPILIVTIQIFAFPPSLNFMDQAIITCTFGILEYQKLLRCYIIQDAIKNNKK